MTLKQLKKLGLRIALQKLSVGGVHRNTSTGLQRNARDSGTVALVWMIDEDASSVHHVDPDRFEQLSEFDTVVVVCQPKFFSELRSMGFFYEAVPTVHDIRKSNISSSWKLYLMRKIARIRDNWAADFEFVIGKSPEEYYRDFWNLG